MIRIYKPSQMNIAIESEISELCNTENKYIVHI